MKIKITADSTVDMSKELLEKYNVSTHPLSIILGDKSYTDGLDVDGTMIFDFVAKTKILPKTAAPNMDNFKSFFEQFTNEGYAVIHFSLSSKISLCNHCANLAAQELENVYVIDSLSLSSGTALLAIYAKELADQGLDVKEVYEKCLARVPAVQASFVVDTLDYLHKGGRCSSIALLGSKILKIKPTILLREGKMETGKKYLGNIERNILKYVEDIMSHFNTPDNTRIFITHTHADPEMVESVRNHLKENYQFKEILETIAGATITSHCGRNTLGILFLNDGEQG